MLSSFLFSFAISAAVVNLVRCQEGGILYPQDSESRNVRSLDGVWNFRIAPKYQPNLGFDQAWHSRPLEQTGDVLLMPVPSSYNDITQSREIRDHIGWAWYDREFWVPLEWNDGRRIFVRFGSVNYHAVVFINGQEVTTHSGGHLPFQVQLSNLNFTNVNRITVAVNNTLSAITVPQGFTQYKNDDRFSTIKAILNDPEGT